MNMFRSLLGLASFAACALAALPSAERPRKESVCDGCGAPMPGKHKVPGPNEFWNLAACRFQPSSPMSEAEAQEAARSRPLTYQSGR